MRAPACAVVAARASGTGGTGGRGARRACRGRTPLWRRSARGLTFLEIVLAMALLGLVATAALSGVRFALATQRRAQLQLDAMEVANRLVLMRLDEKATMPQQSLPIEYNSNRFRWTMSEQEVYVDAEEGSDPELLARATGVLRGVSLIRVRAWLGEESGGTRDGEGGVPEATIERLWNPLWLARNPDSAQNMVATPAGQREFVERMERATRGRSTRTRTPGGGGGGGGASDGGRP